MDFQQIDFKNGSKKYNLQLHKVFRMRKECLNGTKKCPSMLDAANLGCESCIPRFIENINTLYGRWSPLHLAIENNYILEYEGCISSSTSLDFIKKLIEYEDEIE